MTSVKRTTFFDFPIDNESYVTRPYVKESPPIRVLITDAGHKFVYCLLHKICAGAVFGEEQEVYVHLINSKGVIDHKSVFLELEECGFHLLKGWVATSNVEQAYTGVDYVVVTSTFDEQSGVSHKETLVGQIIRERQMMRHIAEYCKPGVKIVVTGPSTKYLLLQLSILSHCEPRVPPRDITAVTLLDEAIARANLAARLKTTTDKVKDVVIWGMTCPDVHNATVRMLPPGDLGAQEEVDVPVHEALQDDRYLRDEFVKSIFWREIGLEFSRSGMSMAMATARHLRLLFRGSQDEDGIASMGVLTPASEPCMVPEGTPFSFPVRLLGGGNWEIREDVRYDVGTHLHLIRTVNRHRTCKMAQGVIRAVEFMKSWEEGHGEPVRGVQRQAMMDLLELDSWRMKYYVAPLPCEAVPKTSREPMTARKSIAWDDRLNAERDSREEVVPRKSSIRFGLEEARRTERALSILRRVNTEESVVLPPIAK